MKITIDIPAATIAQLFASAIEGGDAVTTASRGGWCSGIYWKSKDLPESQLPRGAWYTNANIYTRPLALQIVEIVNETTGRKRSHWIGSGDVARGLAVMARVFPRQFEQVLQDNVDGPCADAFLQSMLFGKEKYA